jgi:PAS domain S-box-containing protein
MIEACGEEMLMLAGELQRGGLDPVFERVETGEALEGALCTHAWDLILCDYGTPELPGSAALEMYQRSGVDIPFISICGNVGEENVAEIMKAGAHDCVMKSNLARLVPAVKRELRAAQERRDRRQAEAISRYLASIVQSCDDAIAGTTLEGIVVSWNAGAERIYGYTAEEMIGHSMAILVPPYRPDELADRLTNQGRNRSGSRRLPRRSRYHAPQGRRS